MRMVPCHWMHPKLAGQKESGQSGQNGQTGKRMSKTEFTS